AVQLLPLLQSVQEYFHCLRKELLVSGIFRQQASDKAVCQKKVMKHPDHDHGSVRRVYSMPEHSFLYALGNIVIRLIGHMTDIFQNYRLEIGGRIQKFAVKKRKKEWCLFMKVAHGSGE